MTRAQRQYLEWTMCANMGVVLGVLSERASTVALGILLVGVGVVGRFLALRRLDLERTEKP